jgi:hypothetical protein
MVFRQIMIDDMSVAGSWTVPQSGAEPMPTVPRHDTASSVRFVLLVQDATGERTPSMRRTRSGDRVHRDLGEMRASTCCTASLVSPGSTWPVAVRSVTSNRVVGGRCTLPAVAVRNVQITGVGSMSPATVFAQD